MPVSIKYFLCDLDYSSGDIKEVDIESHIAVAELFQNTGKKTIAESVKNQSDIENGVFERNCVYLCCKSFICSLVLFDHHQSSQSHYCLLKHKKLCSQPTSRLHSAIVIHYVLPRETN
jgi:hypothetical protein